MTEIVSYTKIVTRETSTWLAAPQDVDGTPLTTELTTLNGTTYVAVPDDVTLPTQPAGITPEPVTLTSELRDAIIAASPHTRLIRQRQAERVNGGVTAERAALWAAQQLEALGLADAQTVIDAALGVLAARRYRAETAGTTWNGHPVATDRQSQALITGAVVASQQSGFTALQWKMTDGTFVKLTATKIKAMGDAVAAHVQAAFANEATLIPAVTADIDADIETGWPA